MRLIVLPYKATKPVEVPLAIVTVEPALIEQSPLLKPKVNSILPPLLVIVKLLPKVYWFEPDKENVPLLVILPLKKVEYVPAILAVKVPLLIMVLYVSSPVWLLSSIVPPVSTVVVWVTVKFEFVICNLPVLFTVIFLQVTATFAVTVLPLQITISLVAVGREAAAAPPHPTVLHVLVLFQFPEALE